MAKVKPHKPDPKPAAEGAPAFGTSPLRNTDDAFRLLVERVKDYAIFMVDLDGRVASWNEGAQRIKGYQAGEIIGRPIELFYTPEDRRRGHPAELLKIAETEGRVEEEGWRVRSDGTPFWADVVITALRDSGGVLRGYGKVTRDLTERREAGLALAELAGRLLQSQDDERHRISRELHDSTSPLLTGLASKLYTAKQRAGGADPSIAALLDDSLTTAETMATVIRSVSSLLHPPLLDQNGLLASLRWYAASFAARHNAPTKLDVSPKLGRLPRATELALFRIVQEALSNVVGAVGSTHAKVIVKVHGQKLTLVIEGDGRDVTPELIEAVRTQRGEVGISVAGIRERLRQLGGRLDISTAAGKICIKSVLPLSGEYAGPLV